MPDNIVRLSKDQIEDGRIELVDRSGKRITLALQPSDVHDPTELPTYLGGFKPFNFRADEASPVVLMDNYQDKIRNFSSNDAFRLVSVKGSPSGAIPEVDPSSSLTSITALDRYIGSFIPTQTEAATGNNYQPRMAAARRCANALLLDREVDAWTLLGTNTNWAATQRTSATSAWTNTGADPILDIETAIEKSLQPVSGLWMNQKSAHEFLRCDKVKDHMRQMLGDSAVDRAVANVADAGAQNVDFRIPGLPPIHVAASKYWNETGSSYDYVLGDVVVLTCVPAGVPMDGETIASSYTFRVKGPSGTGYETREFFVPNRGPQGGTFVVVSMADIATMTANTAGGIITGI